MLHVWLLKRLPLGYALPGLLVLVVQLAACQRRVVDYPVPRSARVASNGMKYVVLRPGDGRAASAGGIWGIEWKLVSHTKPGCEFPCTTYALHPARDARIAQWRALLVTMREGEVRRVWVRWPGKEEEAYEVALASVVKTDAAGNAVIEHSYPNLRKPLPGSTRKPQ